MAAPIPGFTRLTSSISFHRSEAPSPEPSHPSLMVLCTWMAAAEKHIAKYAAGYRRLFPHTSILLCQCSVGAVLHTSAAKHRELLEPARNIILSFQGPIVLHAFSNGGSTIATHLSLQLKKEPEWSGFEKVILDCTPSTPTVVGAVDAIAFSLPTNPILRFLGRLVLRAIISTYLLFFVRLAGGEDGVHWIRRILNTPDIFDRKAERLYVYSEEDQLVQHWAVKQHAEDARVKGYSVREEKFERGGHCALGVGEGAERYWGVVGKFLRGREG